MTRMTKPGAIIKIRMLQNSEAKNYFESKERLFLGTSLEKLLKDDSEDFPLNSNEADHLQQIYLKYKKLW